MYNIFLFICFCESLLIDPKRKTLICGSIPTENLPKRKFDVVKPQRRVLVRQSDDVCSASSLEPTSTKIVITPSLDSVVKQVQDTMPAWKVSRSSGNGVKVELYDNVHSLPKYTVLIDSSLEFTVAVYNWPVKENHPMYKELKRSVMYHSISELLSGIEKSSLCQGLPADFDVMSVVVDPTSKVTTPGTLLRHSLPKIITSEQTHIETSIVLRSVDCEVIDNNLEEQQCKPCRSANTAIKKASRRKSRASEAPAKDKAPLAACGPAKLRATVRTERLHSKELEERLQALEKKIKANGVHVDEAIDKDILQIMSNQNLDATPHMKFFWEQQVKLLQSNKHGRRYHPQVIRFALSLHAKSAAAYREVRESGALILPSERVLRDYKNYFKPKAGINKENIEHLREKTSSFFGIQRYVAIIMDEMKIQSNLVFDKNSGDLVGFIDLGDPMTNYANLQEDDTVATHALAFLARGLCTDMKHIVGYYFTGMYIK